MRGKFRVPHPVSGIPIYLEYSLDTYPGSTQDFGYIPERIYVWAELDTARVTKVTLTENAHPSRPVAPLKKRSFQISFGTISVKNRWKSVFQSTPCRLRWTSSSTTGTGSVSSSLPAMCSCACARLLPPLFSPAPSPKPRPAFPHGPTPARSRAVVALAGAASRDDAPAPLSGFDFLALKRELEEEEEEAVVSVDAKEGGGAVNEDDGESGAERSAGGTRRRRRRRQMARRSALLAKQVISVSSARSLGFVSQLWIDAASVCEGCCSLHFILWVWSSCVLWHRVARGRRLAFAFHNIVQLPY